MYLRYCPVYLQSDAGKLIAACEGPPDHEGPHAAKLWVQVVDPGVTVNSRYVDIDWETT